MANNFYGSPLRDDESEDQNSASEGGNEREEVRLQILEGINY